MFEFSLESPLLAPDGPRSLLRGAILLDFQSRHPTTAIPSATNPMALCVRYPPSARPPTLELVRVYLNAYPFRTANMSLFAEAFERIKHLPVRPWSHAVGDDMRDCIDRAATATTGMDLQRSGTEEPGSAASRPCPTQVFTAVATVAHDETASGVQRLN